VTKTLSLLFFSAVAGTAVASTGTSTAPITTSTALVNEGSKTLTLNF
jgi:hypothetical protein